MSVVRSKNDFFMIYRIDFAFMGKSRSNAIIQFKRNSLLPTHIQGLIVTKIVSMPSLHSETYFIIFTVIRKILLHRYIYSSCDVYFDFNQDSSGVE